MPTASCPFRRARWLALQELAKLVGERHYDPFFRHLAVYRYYAGGKRMPGDHAGNIVCVAFKYGWFWYIPLSGGRTSVGLVMGRDAYNERKHAGAEAVFDAMVEQAPMLRDLLVNARPCSDAPYDAIRVELDYSYINSRFSKNGVFLAGDAACFIDPVFSSGVHLATYAGYLAAQAISRVLGGDTDEQTAAAAYEDLYRREYSAFYRFLTSFYELHVEPESYFWEAQKVLRQGEDGTGVSSAMDAFVSIISGQATAGATLFGSGDNFADHLETGRKSFRTMVAKVSGDDVSDADLFAAKNFMSSIHEGRHRILQDG